MSARMQVRVATWEVALGTRANRGPVPRLQISVCEMVFRSTAVQSTAGAFSAKSP
jgi:hypothetical protein